MFKFGTNGALVRVSLLDGTSQQYIPTKLRPSILQVRRYPLITWIPQLAGNARHHAPAFVLDPHGQWFLHYNSQVFVLHMKFADEQETKKATAVYSTRSSQFYRHWYVEPCTEDRRRKQVHCRNNRPILEGNESYSDGEQVRQKDFLSLRGTLDAQHQNTVHAIDRQWAPLHHRIFCHTLQRTRR